MGWKVERVDVSLKHDWGERTWEWRDGKGMLLGKGTNDGEKEGGEGAL